MYIECIIARVWLFSGDNLVKSAVSQIYCGFVIVPWINLSLQLFVNFGNKVCGDGVSDLVFLNSDSSCHHS